MYTFYQQFLSWALQDEDLILIIKEKKPAFLNRLNELSSLIDKLSKVGRVVRFSNVINKIPVEICGNAEFCVGIGVSTAVMECVIAGYKGIHCDLAKHYFHPYYSWGRNRIIFDNIEVLISQLKAYKNNPDTNTNKELGCWDSCITNIDPFRDGSTTARTSDYLLYLIDAYKSTQSRAAALACADNQYNQKWGDNLIINRRI